MTGLEKLTLASVASVTGMASAVAQVTISNVGTMFGIGWAIIGAVLGIGISQGMTRQRLNNLEKRVDQLASKESVDALHDKLDTVTKMLDSRIIDRRHP
jgi:hypothetical protein